MTDTKIIFKRFRGYVVPNILGMLGISAYILADTFFISRVAGANGLTALNLCLPVYSLIFAIGSMIAVGSATRFRIFRAQGSKEADLFFPNALFFTLLFSLIFMIIGLLLPGQLLTLLGGDADITALGKPYTRIFMLFTPFFMWNYVFNAFVRNDGNPSLAMVSTLSSSLFNIVMDYVLMFPLGLGMIGAALATAISPVVGILICLVHVFSKKSSISFRKPAGYSFSVRKLVQGCQLGVSAFVGQMSNGVTTLVFNFLILALAGNLGVAAYGVIANVAFVAMSIFNGISEGSQPLFSEYYGKGDFFSLRRVLRYACIAAVIMAAAIVVISFVFADPIVAVFNSENNPTLAEYAIIGIEIYFIGFLFTGLDIAGTGFLNAVAAVKWGAATSLLRGFVMVILCALILSRFFGLNGVWASYPVSEGIMLLIIFTGIFSWMRMMKKKTAAT